MKPKLYQPQIITNGDMSTASTSTIVKCVAGDTIGIFSDSNATIDGTSAPYFSTFSITRVGN